MKYDPHQHDIKAIEAEIIDETDRQHEAVANGNNELAQMIQLSLQGLKLRRERLLAKQTK
jgi:hypothetical protein